MAYLPPTNIALRAKYDRWDIALWMTDADIVGSEFILGYDDPGVGWTRVLRVDGPYDNGTWQNIMTSAGGMGSYIVSKFPMINAALAAYFDPTPQLPVETNATPFSIYDFNVVLKQYLKIERTSANDDKPVLRLA